MSILLFFFFALCALSFCLTLQTEHTSFSYPTLIFHFLPSLLERKATAGLTSRHLLHEDLYEAILTEGSQVLHDVLVLQVFVESNLLMERLRVPMI